MSCEGFFDPAFLLPGGAARKQLRLIENMARRDSVELRAFLERASRQEGRPGGPPHWVRPRGVGFSTVSHGRVAPRQFKAAAA
jgi:hypothetical protein